MIRSQFYTEPPPEQVRAEEITDRLRRAIRHGQPDLARRLHRDLLRLGRDVTHYELAAASTGGGR